MTETHLLRIERPLDGAVLLTLNRPSAMNALSSALREQLIRTLQSLAGDSGARVLIITGAGKAFCAGLDLKELSRHGATPESIYDGDLIGALNSFAGPIIGAINGAAVTGGFELALACDLLVASSNASFADTHARVGVMPGWGMSQKLSRIIGPARAKELSLTSNFLSAKQAEQWGLVNRVVAPAELLPNCLALAADMLCALPEFLVAYKRVIDEGFATTLDEGLRIESKAAKAQTAGLDTAAIAQRRDAVRRRGQAQLQESNAARAGPDASDEAISPRAAAPPRRYALVQINDAIATITINNPSKLNAMSPGLLEDLRVAFAQLRENAALRALILTGAGRAFCSGADLSSIAANPAPGATLGDRIAEHMHQVTNTLLLEIRTLPIPVIIAVNGPAAGAGAGLAMSGDVILMARSAYLYLPFIDKLGIVPDMGSTWLLPRLVGRARATALTLLGERLGAEQAVQMGLAWASVDDAQLPAQAQAMAERLAKLPAHAIIETRRAFDASESNTLAQQLHYEAERQRELIKLPSFAEGVRAFAEKRAPEFPGR